MKTIVLDDDPTGTQAATDAPVLLAWDADSLVDVLATAPSVYLQTNSRALPAEEAVRVTTRIRDLGEKVGRGLGERVRFVLRGDSTLRGHVFAETGVFLEEDAVMLFVPAFPAGGRTTLDGLHLVRIGDEVLPAAATEYARDPVFPFSSSRLDDYVLEKSDLAPVLVPLASVRSGAEAVAAALRTAPARSVVLPDAVTDEDIAIIAAGVRLAEADGVRVVVRSAAPLAAELAGVRSSGLLPGPFVPAGARALVVCGSHTHGATAQLERFRQRWGEPVVIGTDAAFEHPEDETRRVTDLARRRLASIGLAIVATERDRRAEHGSLADGERVMAVLTSVVRSLLGEVHLVVSKGGITSAEVAAVGLGAVRARVLGQILPGISAWEVDAADGRRLPYIIVPGNVGGPDALVEAERIGRGGIPGPHREETE